MTAAMPWRPPMPDAISIRGAYNPDVWLVVVDDDEDSGNVVADHLPNRPVFTFSNVDEATRFMQYNRDLRPLAADLPAPLAIVTLVDLWMGGPTGLDTISALRDVTNVPVYPILRSNGADGGRELLAVAAAEVWGHDRPNPGLHYMPKDFRPRRWVEDFEPCLDAVAATALAHRAAQDTEGRTPARSVNDLGPLTAKLRWIRPLTIVTGSGRETTLLKWLARVDWQLEYLRRLTVGDTAEQARLNSKAPQQFRDIAKSLGPLIWAHNTASPEGRWLDYEGLLDFAVYDAENEVSGGKRDHQTFITEFAGRERFMFGSATLPEIISTLYDQ